MPLSKQPGGGEASLPLTGPAEPSRLGRRTGGPRNVRDDVAASGTEGVVCHYALRCSEPARLAAHRNPGLALGEAHRCLTS